MSRGLSVRSAVALFVVLMSVWLLNSGHYTPMLFGFSVVSCALVVWLALRMGIVDDEALPVRLLPRWPPGWNVPEIFAV